MSQEALGVLIQRYAGRVAQLRQDGAVVGYLFAYDSTAPAVARRWWRAEVPEWPALGWLIEWTDPARSKNGYTDEAGIAGPEDVDEVVHDWDTQRHEHDGECLNLTWLADSDAKDVATRYGW